MVEQFEQCFGVAAQHLDLALGEESDKAIAQAVPADH